MTPLTYSITSVRGNCADASQEEVRMKLVLAEPLSELQESARHIADVSNECKLSLSQDEYVASFKPTLMDVVHAWSKVRGYPYTDLAATAVLHGHPSRRRPLPLLAQI